LIIIEGIDIEHSYSNFFFLNKIDFGLLQCEVKRNLTCIIKVRNFVFVEAFTGRFGFVPEPNMGGTSINSY
jgi:hypothetical protein